MVEETGKIPIDDSNSKINEIEVNFIQELNKLYEKYYGSKREYKVPTHLIDKNETNKTNYAHLLMELNKRCSKWISKHVEESPFVYLTPIFIDYFNYLIQLEKEFFPTTTLFTKSENGGGVYNKPATTAASALFNGVTKFNSEINITPITTLTSSKPVEEVSTTTMMFPSSVAGTFKFAPIPLATVVSQPAAAVALNQESSFLKFVKSDNETPLSTFTTAKPSNFFGSTNVPSLLPKTDLNKKQEDSKPNVTSPLSFSFGSEISVPKSAVPPAVSNLFSFNQTTTTTTSPSASSNFFSMLQNKTTTTTTPVTPIQVTTAPSTNLFSFASNQAAPVSTTKPGFFSMLSNQASSDTPKPFSFGNLPSSTSLFGGSSFGFGQAQPAATGEAQDGEGGGEEGKKF